MFKHFFTSNTMLMIEETQKTYNSKILMFIHAIQSDMGLDSAYSLVDKSVAY